MLSLFEGGLGMMPFKGFSVLVAAKAVRAKPCKPWRCPSGAPARQHVP